MNVQRCQVQEIGQKHNGPIKHFELVCEILQAESYQLQNDLQNTTH